MQLHMQLLLHTGHVVWEDQSDHIKFTPLTPPIIVSVGVSPLGMPAHVTVGENP